MMDAMSDAVEMLRSMLRATECAMEAEGIPEETRTRVVHTIIWGVPDPDLGPPTGQWVIQVGDGGYKSATPVSRNSPLAPGRPG